MKKLLLTVCAALASFIIMASETDLMIFEMHDGSKQSIFSTNLTMTFADGLLNATDGTQSLSIPLNTVRAFYFGSQSGVGSVSIPENQAIEAYSVAGVHQGTFKSLQDAKAALPTGLFILKAGHETNKVVVR